MELLKSKFLVFQLKCSVVAGVIITHYMCEIGIYG